ncbi:MAG: murein biosynthesis integral membrane protein MurJ [Ktedonobacter sp. 13_1_20CM_3_54_15]|nr:MAG: murein biosynthesis integral membrane protein MurJ [Ktedonobacter sp. 13_2_20CM_2_54_8]OLE06077.1 MAG: murein biosynthesis integral membrane protein MurJ [Ktedonobacter sp. 13_1_20CM_4_53_11]OLE31981.1 MAG: murein biosynthesis integral membrane protein MurJ [Ktedonobacter sp. 13_1_20CM_3_54_15]
MAKDSIEESKTGMEAVPVVNAGTAGTTPELSAIPLGESAAGETLPGERQHIVKSATLVMLGNLGSSVMGMVRQQVVASFGQGIASPFLSAITPAQTFNDFLINGSINGALVPTFNDYAEPEKREQLRRLVFTIVNLVFLIMLVSAIVFLFIAPWFINNIQVPGYTPQEKLLTTQFARIIFFSLLALGPFAVLQAALFARKEFGWPAVATAAYHIGIIIGAIVGALVGNHYLGQYGLAFGVLLGAAGEIALLLPGLRNQRLRYMFVLDLKQPALRRILNLYKWIALSFLVSAFFIILDQSLATRTPGAGSDPGAANYLAMRLSTTLIQFPAGLVATALSVAVLPTLTEHARAIDNERFKKTLLLGFRLGLLLMIPAAAGLMVLGLPIVSLLYQHGRFTAHNAQLTSLALALYAFQLPFVAIDQLLLSAFYARKNTITPVIVGFVCYGSYLAVALPFWQTVGMPALVVANTVQNSLHAVILLVLLRMTIGPLRLREIISAFLKISAATIAMVAVAWGLQVLFGHIRLFSLNHLTGQFLTVLVSGLIAVGVYVSGVLLLRVEEVGMMKGIVMAKLGRRSTL